MMVYLFGKARIGGVKMPERVIVKALEDELVESYLNYSMSVIIGRAIPDVRDGLKPVQRRILYGMMEIGLNHRSPYKKSARIVGEVLGKYHPHVDAPVYEALVRMAQPFTMRYPLIDGQGNFGSIDRDPPAAMRYTEARLTELAEEMLKDIEKNTVKMVPNFDGTLYEPEVLPTRLPNLLVNGATGIAVGMATSIPPHNLSEIMDALVALIDDPEIGIEEILKYVKGPDFPTGGIIVNSQALKKIYTSGKGTIRIRGKVHFEEGSKKNRIVITEIPYMVSKAGLIEEIARYAQSEDRMPIKNIRDESDKRGMRIVVEIPKDVDWRVVVNNLYAHTSLQTTFNVQMLVIDDMKRPRLMNIKDIMLAFLKHRFEIIRRRSEYDYARYSKRAHILEGLMKAARSIDTVVDIVKNSKNTEEAKLELIETLDVTEDQARAILDMRLSRLTLLEMEKLVEEYSNLNSEMEKLRKLLESDEEVYRVMKEELLELKERFGDDRRTVIGQEEETANYTVEDLVIDEDVVITLTRKGFIKSTPLKSYRLQRRGGKGLKGSKVEDEDAVVMAVTGRLKGTTLFVTSRGRAFAIKNYEVDTTSRGSRGRRITDYLKLEQGEKVMVMVELDGDGRDLVFVTKSGKIKRLPISSIENVRSTRGIRIMRIDEGDEIVGVRVSESEKDTVILASSMGMVVRFPISQVRRMGRASGGILGMRLREGDEVVGMCVTDTDERYLLSVTKAGFGKRTPLKEYKVQRRGGLGLKNLPSGYDDRIAGIALVEEEDEIIVVTKKGHTIRFRASDVSAHRRMARGVRLIIIEDGDEVSQVSVVS